MRSLYFPVLIVLVTGLGLVGCSDDKADGDRGWSFLTDRVVTSSELLDVPEPKFGDPIPDELIVLDEPRENLYSEAIALVSIALDGNRLLLTVEHGGGCGEHTYVAGWYPGNWMESHPVQIDVILLHQDHDDPCDAIVRGDLEYDITPVIDDYHTAYGYEDARFKLNLIFARNTTEWQQETVFWEMPAGH